MKEKEREGGREGSREKYALPLFKQPCKTC